jgi:FAD synthetase
MTAGGLAAKYIEKTERALRELEITQKPVCLDPMRMDEVVDEAKRYLDDAKYYLGKGEDETSLASVAYSEGLLDALRMLGLARFEW